MLEPQASLWKCYMITERWSEADDLLLSNEELRPLLPQQVTRICQGVDRAQFDRVVVLGRLLDLPFIRQRLQVLVAETLVTELCECLLTSLRLCQTNCSPAHFIIIHFQAH